MSVKRILVVCIVVALLYSSLNPISENLVDDATKNPLNYSDSASDLEMKIQLPGSIWEDDSVIEWSPSDFEEHREIQVSVSLSNNIDLDSITQISFTLISLEGATSPSEEYAGNIEIDEFIEAENQKIAYSLHTYPSGIPHGNYSASTTILFDDSTSMTTDLTINMKNYSLGFSYESSLGFCYEQFTIFELKYRNTGGSLTELQFQMMVNTTFEEEWEEQVEIYDGNYEMMGAGEESVYRIEIFVSQDLDASLLPELFNIYVTSRYIDDDGVTQTLFDQDISIQTYFGPCTSKIVPLISEIIDDQSVVPIDATPSSNRFNDAIFPFSDNSYNLRVELPNIGIQDANIMVNFSSEMVEGDFTLIIQDSDGQNISLRGYSFYDVILSQEKLQFDFLINIHNYPNEQIIPINIEIYHQETTDLTTASIELVNPYFQLPLSADNNLNILQNDSSSMTFNIDRTKLSAYQRFDDNWIIDTQFRSIDYSPIDGLQVTELINLDGNIDFENVEFDTGFNLTIELNISCSAELMPSDYELTISMINSPADRYSTIQYNVGTIVTVLKNNSLPEVEEPQNNETNNTSGNSSGQNNSQNQTTDFDSDKDGILDSQDLCPNTAEGIIVDEFGCKIIEDNNNNNSGNLTEELPDEENQQQGSESTSNKSTENDVLIYLIVGLISIVIIGGIVIIRGRKTRQHSEISQLSATKQISPLPVMPLPALEPVVLQQWTDANGYSWRQMSDQTIMWWNGTDWIPYGKN